MKRLSFSLAAVLAAILAYACWQYPDQFFRDPALARTEAPDMPRQAASTAPPTADNAAPTTAPTTAAEAREQMAQQRVEDVHESADAESALERILPRRSIGHAQGLDKAPDPLKLTSSAALVLDAQTRTAAYAKNPDAVLPMASITKLMTAMVVLDAKLPLNESITVTEDDVDRILSSRSRLRVGSVLSRSDAMHLALMSSENRAAHALARTHPGGLDAFIRAMNHKARQLGMASTVFHDPTGLSASNVTTARDLATMVLAASGYPLIREHSTTLERTVTIGKRMLRYRNSNPLVRDSGWDIDMQKTGYIVEAGHCVVMRTKMAGQDLVVVLLDSSSNARRLADARRIQQWLAPMEARAAQKAAPQRSRSAARPAARKPVKQARSGRGAATARVRKTIPAGPALASGKRDDES